MLVFPILDEALGYLNPIEQYKVVIVELVGYGYSDDSNHSQMMEVLSETRQALQATSQGHLSFCPHSMASLESLALAGEYPELK